MIDKPEPLQNFWPDFIAGSLAGSAGIAIGHPFDTIKIRQQSRFKFPQQSDLFTEAEKHSLIRKVRVLFRGLSIPLLTEGVKQSLFFGCYGWAYNNMDYFRSKFFFLADQDEKSSSQRYINIGLAGCWGGFSQSFLAFPVEQLKTMLQSERSLHRDGSPRGSIEFLREALKSRHFYSLCIHTLLCTIYRDVPAYMAYMVTFEWLKDKFPEFASRLVKSNEGKLKRTLLADMTNNLISGGIAGIACWLITMPFDAVKTRLHIEVANPKPRYHGIWDCMYKMVKEEGFHSLFRGTTVTVIRAFPVNAVTLTVYVYMLEAFSLMI